MELLSRLVLKNEAGHDLITCNDYFLYRSASFVSDSVCFFVGTNYFTCFGLTFPSGRDQNILILRCELRELI